MFFDEREPGKRLNNNHRTTFALADPEPKQKYDFKNQEVRQR